MINFRFSLSYMGSFFVSEHIRACRRMMPRRGRTCGVPEGVGSGIQAIEIDTQRELRQLRYRMEAMEKINSESINTSNEEESFEEEE